MMEAENRISHEVQVFPNWLNTSKTRDVYPWNNHGVNLAWSVAEAKLLDTGDCHSSSCNCELSLYQPFNGNASKSKAFIA